MKEENNRNRHRGSNRRVYREIKRETPRGDWRRMATEARRITTQPPKSAYKGGHNEQNRNAPDKVTKTRASIIRGMSRTQKVPSKDREPDTNKMKWKYGETIKVASTNVRGMRDPVKREEIITQIETNGVDIMRLQETKIPGSCYEVMKGYIFVFSSTSTDREYWGVGICYKNYIEKYRNYYRQVPSNMIAMELNTHGNPPIITSAYIPHENTNDERIRQRAWEDPTDFVT